MEMLDFRHSWAITARGRLEPHKLLGNGDEIEEPRGSDS